MSHINRPGKIIENLSEESEALKMENDFLKQVMKEFNKVFEFQWQKIIISVSQKYRRQIFTAKIEASICFEIRSLLTDLYPPGFVEMISISINSLSKEITIEFKGT
jgi:ribosomal protein L32E